MDQIQRTIVHRHLGGVDPEDYLRGEEIAGELSNMTHLRVVSQDRLQAVNTLRAIEDNLKSQLKRIRESRKEAEGKIIDAVKSDKPIESGPLSARVESYMSRTRPRWKQVAKSLAKKLGKAFSAVEESAREDAKERREERYKLEIW